MDQQVILPSGREVRLRNRTVFSGNGGRRLQLMIQVETTYRIGQVADDARELADVFHQFARQNDIDGLQVTVCLTPNCLAFKERPALLFTFRLEGSAWVLQPTRI
ncbi:MAG TPA: hypothetical protein VGM82_00055 [Gemmatimonadaceae bacterium]|jgi:hypothetical protein